jgi:predicted DNA-binding WGR domain protein
MDLELRNPVRRRVYGITVLRSLFGEPELWIQWGPIGAPARIRRRIETFDDLGTLLARRRELLMRRALRGYVVVGGAELEARERRIRAPMHRACFADGCRVRLWGRGATLCAKHRRETTP